MIGSSSIGTSIPKISPRNHHDIRGINHIVNLTHGGLIFDFRDDLCGAAPLLHHPAKFLQIASLPRKAECNEVHPELRAECNIRKILFRQRRQIDPDTGQIDVAPRAKRSLRKDFAPDPVLFFLQDKKTNDAVIDQDGVAG